jgi:hypothetical protein
MLFWILDQIRPPPSRALEFFIEDGVDESIKDANPKSMMIEIDACPYDRRRFHPPGF